MIDLKELFVFVPASSKVIVVRRKDGVKITVSMNLSAFQRVLMNGVAGQTFFPFLSVIVFSIFQPI